MSYSATRRWLLLSACALGLVALGAVPKQATDASSATVVSVAIVGMAFEPREVEVSPGDIVTWTNRSEYPHSVSADPANLATGGPNSDAQYAGGLLPGESYSWTVPSDSSSGRRWYYHCRYHGQPGDGTKYGNGMAGLVSVK